MPDGRQEQRGTCGYEAKEEDYNEGVLVVYEIVAQARATVRDAAIGEFDVELAERGGYVQDEEPVEEA